MNRIEKTLLVMALAGLSFSVHAVTSENPYEPITDRNIFHLNPPPVAATPTNNEPVLDRKIEFSGISNVGGHKKAWFVVSPKAGSKELPLYINLAEGERQDFLQVLDISEEKGQVKIMNSGNAMVLSLENNSLKPQAVAPSAPTTPPAVPIVHTTPGMPAHSAPKYGNSAVTGSAPNPSPTYGNGYSYNNNGGVTVSGGTTVTSGNSVNNSSTLQNGGLRTIPTRTLRLAPTPTQNTAPPVDPVTQRVMMEVQQEQARQQGVPFPPAPPIP